MMADINKGVREVQTTCRFILKRVNELAQKSHKCSCSRSIDEIRQEVKTLSEKLTEIQEEQSNRDDALAKLQLLTEELLTQQTSFEADLALIIQTEDLKLKRSTDPSSNHQKKEKEIQMKSYRNGSEAAKVTDSSEGRSSMFTDDEIEVLEAHLKDKRDIDEDPINKQADVESSDRGDNGEDEQRYEEKAECRTTELAKHVTFDPAVKDTDSSSRRHRSTPQKRIPKSPIKRFKQHEPIPEADTEKGARDHTSSWPRRLNSDRRNEKPTVEVVRQPFKKYMLMEFEWQIHRDAEIEKAMASGIKNIGGVHTILLVDISESMEHAWVEVKTFVHDYLSGLQAIRIQYGFREDYVALVTFGHETLVQQRLTNDFTRLLQCFDSLKVGGPSPLHGGLHMAVAAAGSSRKQQAHIGEMTVRSRVIIITDGELTEPDLEMGPDVADPAKVEVTKNLLFADMECTKEYDLDMFFVPVGAANMSNFDLMVSLCNGTLLTFQDGRQMARRSLLALNADPFDLGAPIQLPEPLSERDKADIQSMEEKARLHLDTNKKERPYIERDDDVLPAPGSRVRRGPDWHYDDSQDEMLPGTIIGHDSVGESVWVSWDTDTESINVYRYGSGGNFDVLLVDEPVRLKPGTQIAVGCRVETGPAWREKTQRKSGVVLRLFVDEQNIPRAKVRWGKKDHGDYIYMLDRNTLPEIIVSAEESPSGSGSDHRASTPSAQGLKTTDKNKNKNA